MNTLNKQDMAATVNIKLFMATAIAALFLASSAASAQPRELESSQSLTPFTAASVGIAKKAENSEQAAEQEQQALTLLQQAAPAKNVTEVAAAAVKSLAPALSSKAPTANRVQLMGASPMTREQVTAKHASQGIPSSSATSDDPYRAPVYHSFSIFDASSRLFEDFDYDGFYQTFSVTFDVDVNGAYLNERADLFAELYLSRDGGPWVHYYTTDVFTIYGDSTQDDYEVLTTLYTGYATDHYDVLIDVYEVGYSDIVATISADETDSLYALPLESSDRDREPDIIVVEESGGAFSVLGLLCLSLCAGLRLNRTRA
ncbi:MULTISPECIES: choice-of-anchor H family protein [unclassified Shewanella]|uniref:choice-of-anchor H family protein n=1 Tax=Shewanella TaxID=22 RepID=UPI0018E3BFF9|nr:MULTISPECIES: choice-of-anchor H family protein [unclassified Shewanella]MBI1674116.1 choice-of-anchor H family protein [Shewanella sp. DW31]MCU8022861.1 choice-of-anchor H family protein [Shewanella sp. SM78]MCU8043762.1 choice-of-anchor H family protein [Shewanella sp. SM68]MCU8047845.1 choice-of-anchor H family protein [Shewanella sp. SM65]MCU8079851.1 choice-of-anchor H family protein [Shewanella sp. SM103]